MIKSCQNHDKNKNFIMKNNRSLRIRVTFTLFYPELAPTDP